MGCHFCTVRGVMLETIGANSSVSKRNETRSTEEYKMSACEEVWTENAWFSETRYAKRVKILTCNDCKLCNSVIIKCTYDREVVNKKSSVECLLSNTEHLIMIMLYLFRYITRVEAGSNTSTVTLRVVRGDEMGLKKAAP
jgi:hypothetical protein